MHRPQEIWKIPMCMCTFPSYHVLARFSSINAESAEWVLSTAGSLTQGCFLRNLPFWWQQWSWCGSCPWSISLPIRGLHSPCVSERESIQPRSIWSLSSRYGFLAWIQFCFLGRHLSMLTLSLFVVDPNLKRLQFWPQDRFNGPLRVQLCEEGLLLLHSSLRGTLWAEPQEHPMATFQKAHELHLLSDSVSKQVLCGFQYKSRTRISYFK